MNLPDEIHMMSYETLRVILISSHHSHGVFFVFTFTPYSLARIRIPFRLLACRAHQECALKGR